ncbi:MAG: LEA type 2 family protein, partial [Nitrososphaerales archaeon]
AVIVAVIMQYYALNNLQEVQFSPRSVGDFDAETLSLGIEIDASNPTQFPTGFDKIRFELDYKSKEFANMIVQGQTLMPKQATTLHGRIHFNADSVENWWQAYNIFTGFNHEDINLKVTLDTKAFGFIPVSADRNFSYDEFVALVVLPHATQFSCA